MAVNKQIAVFVIAENIQQETIDRFESCLNQSCGLEVDVYIVKGEKRTKEDQFKQFNKCKLLNNITKKLINKNYDVLIQTDIDVIVPPELVRESYDHCMSVPNLYYHNEMVRVDPESDAVFKQLPKTYTKLDWDKYRGVMKRRWIDAAGCWNASRRENWIKTGGWCEGFVAWGREDDHHKSMVRKHSGLQLVVKKHPLLHYDHPRRTKDNRRQNDVVRKKQKGFKNWLT